MLHPDTELRLINHKIGYGVFATRDIPKGTMTWALDPLDRVLEESELLTLAVASLEIVEKYTWVNASGQRVLCWDFGRYINHSCEANSLSPGSFDFEIAVRDIAAGEEITCDYGTLNLERPMSCTCGSASCRHTIRPEDFEDFADRWDQKIRAAFPLILRTPQPLMEWFAAPTSAIKSAAKNPENIPSVLAHCYRPALLDDAGKKVG